MAKYAAARRGLGQFGVALAKPRNTPSPRLRGEGRGEGPSRRVAGRLIPAQQGGFIVNFPNVPNGWSQGENRDEALAQAEDLRGIRPL